MNVTKMAEKLIELRGDRSQKEVAKKLKISKSALGMYETGKRIPRDSIKLRIAEYYHVAIGDIFFIK